ncbi:MAG: twin transmembrane helix small protein [Alphaproteobacteria bacterium]|jgi:hypothetical protein|nr:twin transmembrane helix small protein [Alphaproteobacteria bacterium]
MSAVLNTLIPVFTGITFLVLLIGIVALFRGGKFGANWSNRLMRMRVLFQFIVVLLIAAASWFASR